MGDAMSTNRPNGPDGPDITKEVYLGDGLYAFSDGWQIKLRAPDTMSGDRVVYLDPSVQAALVEYIKRAGNC
jgi:hypothetical protein